MMMPVGGIHWCGFYPQQAPATEMRFQQIEQRLAALEYEAKEKKP
jgi:hypothetical protein